MSDAVNRKSTSDDTLLDPDCPSPAEPGLEDLDINRKFTAVEYDSEATKTVTVTTLLEQGSPAVATSAESPLNRIPKDMCDG